LAGKYLRPGAAFALQRRRIDTPDGDSLDLYFGGDMEASIALSGQVCGRIDAVRPVAEIIAEVREQFFTAIGRLADQYPASA